MLTPVKPSKILTFICLC